MRNFEFLYSYVACFLLVGLGVSLGRAAESDRLRPRFEKRLAAERDSFSLINKQEKDSLDKCISGVFAIKLRLLNAAADSIVTVSRKHLDSTRIAVVKALARDKTALLEAQAGFWPEKIETLSNRFSERLEREFIKSKTCDSCADDSDFNDAAESFHDIADSLIELWRDTAGNYGDTAADTLENTVENSIDELENKADELVDDAQETRRETAGALADVHDSLEGLLPRITAAVAWRRHDYDRGRDWGQNQTIVSPSLSFEKTNGLQVSVQPEWSLDEKRWYELDLNAGFEWSIIDPFFHILPSYTRFWFADMVRGGRDYNSNEINLTLAFTTDIASLSVDNYLDFPERAEFTIHPQIFREFKIKLPLRFVATFTPRVDLNIGQTRLIEQVITTNQTSSSWQVTTSERNTSDFSLMDLEPQCGITFGRHNAILESSFILVIPKNVRGESTNKPFWCVNADFSYDFPLGINFHRPLNSKFNS
ncbi:MAG: hypothetical protein PHC61_12745 [Chitinivibrionales bacterium]|nr:hypothetical protein [Chitinivibrionales bacterium]